MARDYWTADDNVRLNALDKNSPPPRRHQLSAMHAQDSVTISPYPVPNGALQVSNHG